ncbi:hypothetical protein Ciccas_006849 [Cichlidogyrus casuarinus]|uniref:Uncharacterized protein n=1 Tax=Cichlidogyrus casuarinus TaxID=1844966 RepID=A0ABD2Q5M6_9PLAT
MTNDEHTAIRENPFCEAQLESPSSDFLTSIVQRCPENRNIRISVDTFNKGIEQSLRNAISKLTEQNDLLMQELDEQYNRQRQLLHERELGKWTVTQQDLAIQHELQLSKIREADLTIAYEELKHRIQQIDRLVDSVRFALRIDRSSRTAVADS